MASFDFPGGSLIPNQMRSSPVDADRFVAFSRGNTGPAARFMNLAANGDSSTPLLKLDFLADRLGLGSIFVKDESRFLGLNAFKARGCLWAMAKIMGKRLGIPDNELELPALARAQNSMRAQFVAATDGNHGAGVAYGAALLGQDAVIFMPAGASHARVAAIREYGAQCYVTSLNYDGAVVAAADYARANGGILIQDTAWRGYEEIPLWIMRGYAVMAHEILEQLNGVIPTHVFLQVGVGSFAAAILGAFISAAGEKGFELPMFVGLEPENAAWLYESLAACDGEARIIGGDLHTIMDGLSCGVGSVLAWPILRDCLDATAKCADSLAHSGMGLLCAPGGEDPMILSGESGAIGAGALECLAQGPGRERLGLNNSSRVLLISTEGRKKQV